MCLEYILNLNIDSTDALIMYRTLIRVLYSNIFFDKSYRNTNSSYLSLSTKLFFAIKLPPTSDAIGLKWE